MPLDEAARRLESLLALHSYRYVAAVGAPPLSLAVARALLDTVVRARSDVAAAAAVGRLARHFDVAATLPPLYGDDVSAARVALRDAFDALSWHARAALKRSRSAGSKASDIKSTRPA